MTRRICADRLTLPLLLATLPGRGRVTYHAATVTPAARWVLDRLGRVAALVPVVKDLEGATLFGVNLLYRIEGVLLTLAEDLAAEMGDFPLPDSERDFRAEWRRILQTELVHLGRDSVGFIAFIEYALASGKTDASPTDRLTVVFPAPLLGGFIARRYPRAVPGLQLRPWRSARAWADLVRVIPGRPRQWLRLLPFRRRPPAARVDPAASAAGTVFEQAYGQSLRHFPALGHLAWAGAEAVERRRVVLYFDRGDTPCAPQFTAAAESLGFGWADLFSPLAYLRRPGRAVLAALADTAPLFPWRPSEMRLWRWATLTRTLLLHRGHQEAVRRFNVKLLHQCVEFPADTLSLALAVRKNGGLFLWNFWSFLGDPPARYYTGWADLCFAWGPHDAAFYRHIGLDPQAVLETGVLSSGGAADADIEQRVAALRARFPTSARVVAVFDTAFSPQIHNSAAHVAAFYGAILDVAESRPDMCLMVKPKGQSLRNLGDSAVTARLARLEQQGRCVVLDGGEQPLVAILAAELALAMPVGTAGIVAAAMGRKALHLDQSGMGHHPLQALDPGGRLILHDPAAFARAIGKALDGEDGYGDHQGVVGALDPFGDGLGRVRMGTTVAGLLEEFDRGRNAAAAVTAAVARHRAAWGAARAATRPDQADARMMALWSAAIAVIARAAQPRAWRAGLPRPGRES